MYSLGLFRINSVPDLRDPGIKEELGCNSTTREYLPVCAGRYYSNQCRFRNHHRVSYFLFFPFTTLMYKGFCAVPAIL